MSNDQQKTEDPTTRRLEKSRNDGQVAHSADLSSGVLLMLGSMFFLQFGPWFGQALMNQVRLFCKPLGNQDIPNFEMTLTDASGLGSATIGEVGRIVIPLAIAAFLAVGVATAFLAGFRVTMKPLEAKLDKLDPRKGFKRIFSSRSVMRGFNAVLKVFAIVVIATWLLKIQLPRISSTAGKSVAEIISVGWSICIQVSLAISAAMLLVGVVDLIFQKWKHFQDQRMSKQEVRDENKEDEGDPMIKARIKRLQREMSKRQMLRDVPTATVVLTNPTHLAIALKYDRNEDDAPRVVAKGADHLASRIKSLAESNGIPVIERKPLARALYGTVEVGDEIPLELFQAVAEILAYIYRQESSLV